MLSDISSILMWSEKDNGTEPESCFWLSFELKVKEFWYNAKSVPVLHTKLLVLIMTVCPRYLIHIPFKLTCIFHNYDQKDFTINWKTVLVFTFYKLSALLASTWLIKIVMLSNIFSILLQIGIIIGEDLKVVLGWVFNSKFKSFYVMQNLCMSWVQNSDHDIWGQCYKTIPW